MTGAATQPIPHKRPQNTSFGRRSGEAPSSGAAACTQLAQVANMPMAAIAITALASPPRVVSHGDGVCIDQSRLTRIIQPPN
jgi:hypothetical protein